MQYGRFPAKGVILEYLSTGNMVYSSYWLILAHIFYFHYILLIPMQISSFLSIETNWKPILQGLS